MYQDIGATGKLQEWQAVVAAVLCLLLAFVAAEPLIFLPIFPLVRQLDSRHERRPD